MLDFKLSFQLNSGDILFEDTSDYTDFNNITETQITIFSPLIEVEDFVVYILLDDLITTAGDSATITHSESNLPDGVYMGVYQVTSDEGVSSVTKLFFKDLDLKECKKEKIQTLIDNSKNKFGCKEEDCTTNCDIVHFDTLMSTVNDEVLLNRFSFANRVVSYLTKLCKKCNC